MLEKIGAAGLASAGGRTGASWRNGLTSITPRAGRTWASIIIMSTAVLLIFGVPSASCRPARGDEIHLGLVSGEESKA